MLILVPPQILKTLSVRIFIHDCSYSSPVVLAELFSDFGSDSTSQNYYTR